MKACEGYLFQLQVFERGTGTFLLKWYATGVRGL